MRPSLGNRQGGLMEVITVPANQIHVQVLDGDRYVSVEWLEPSEARAVRLSDRTVIVYRESVGCQRSANDSDSNPQSFRSE
jgi:hypothetical protein